LKTASGISTLTRLILNIKIFIDLKETDQLLLFVWSLCHPSFDLCFISLLDCDLDFKSRDNPSD